MQGVFYFLTPRFVMTTYTEWGNTCTRAKLQMQWTVFLNFRQFLSFICSFLFVFFHLSSLNGASLWYQILFNHHFEHYAMHVQPCRIPITIGERLSAYCLRHYRLWMIHVKTVSLRIICFLLVETVVHGRFICFLKVSLERNTGLGL